MKLRNVLLFVCTIALTITLKHLSSRYGVNLAYLDLSRAILTQDIETTNQLLHWSSFFSVDDREYDAATYGAAFMKAKGNETISEEWLSSWWNRDTRRIDPLRIQMARFTLVTSPSHDQVLVACEQMLRVEDAGWLIFVALAHPDQATTIVELFQDRGWISSLREVDRIRLAVIYGNLAWQKRITGGTQEEILILANKALSLNPRDEQGMIEKATVLYDQGQHEAGRALLQQAVDLYPSSSDVWSRVASFELQEFSIPGS